MDHLDAQNINEPARCRSFQNTCEPFRYLDTEKNVEFCTDVLVSQSQLSRIVWRFWEFFNIESRFDVLWSLRFFIFYLSYWRVSRWKTYCAAAIYGVLDSCWACASRVIRASLPGAVFESVCTSSRYIITESGWAYLDSHVSCGLTMLIFKDIVWLESFVLCLTICDCLGRLAARIGEFNVSFMSMSSS